MQRYHLIVILLLTGTLVFGWSVKTAHAQACLNNAGCSAGEVCSYESGPQFRTCQSLNITFTQNGLTATSVSGTVRQNGLGSMTVYGCLGPQTTCAAQPVTNTTYWQNFGTGTGNQAATITGLRSGRTHVVTFQGDSNGDSDLVETAPFTTWPGLPFTPTASNIGDSTATVSWASPFSGDSVVQYSIQPARWVAENAPGGTSTLSGLSAINTGEAWVVGANGVALHRPNDSQLNRDWTAGVGLGANYLTGVDTIDGSQIWASSLGGLMFQSTDRGATWTSSPTGQTDDFFDVAMGTQNTAWAVGRNHRVMYYNGSSWQSKRSGSPGFSLNGIFTLNNINIWAVGSNGQVISSTDQGSTWTVTTLPGGVSEDVRCITSLDGSTIWAGGSNGKLWRFSGGSWSSVPSGTVDIIDDIEMISPTEFYFLAYPRIGHYVNGGITFSSQAATALGTNPTAIAFAHATKGIVAGIGKVGAFSISDYFKSGTGTTTHQVNLDGLAPNTPYYYAAVSTGSGVAQGGFGTFTTTNPDFIPPDIALTDPASGTAYTRNNTYIIKGTISDNARLGSLTCEDTDNRVSVSPAAITVTPVLPVSNAAGVTATWQADVFLGTTDQARHYTCTVSDGNAANNRSVNATVVRDTVAPVVNVINPDFLSSTTYSANPLPLNGDVSDANPLDRMDYQLNAGGPTNFAAPGASGPWSTTMTGMVVGNNNLTVHAYDGAGNQGIAGGTFDYAQPSFTISVAPATQTISAGQPAAYTVTLTPQFGFTGPVNLSLGGNPGGSTVTFTQNPVTLSSAAVNVTMTVQTAAAPTGTFNLTVSGSSGAIVKTASATLVVIAPPDFSLTSTPGSRTVLAGSGTTYTVSVSANATYSGTVAGFNTMTSPSTPLPTGVTYTYNPTSLNLSAGQTQPTTLSITTAPSTANGTYLLRLSGTDTAKSITRFVDVTLIVNQPPDVSLTVLPNSRTISAGDPTAASYNGKAIALNGYNRLSTVTASVGSIIPGLTISVLPNAFVPAIGPAGTDFALNITADSRVPGATYTVTVTLKADDNSLTKTAQVTLIVTGDTAPPIISITQADVNPNYDRATVAWRTNEAANSRLEVYSNAARTTLVGILGDPAFVTTRSLTYVGLNPVTTYYLKVISADQAPTANTASTITFDDGSPLLLTTLDAPDFTPPTIVITQPQQDQTVVGSVTIAGTATDNKTVATAVVTIFRPDMSQTFTQTITCGVSPCPIALNWDSLVGRVNGVFTLKANATDTAGNKSLEFIVTFNVQNDLTPPEVEDGYPQAINLSCASNKCQVTILWYTDDNATSKVEYAREDTYFASGYGVTVDRDDSDPSTSPSAPVHREHRITLTNLDQDYLYHYRITSCNVSTDCTSGN